MTPLESPAMRQAREANALRRLEYLETLDPRQRAVLSWEGE